MGARTNGSDPAAVRNRLDVYQAQTAPVIDWYARSTTPLVRIGAARTSVHLQAFDVFASRAGVPDAALFVVDGNGSLTLNEATRTVSLPLQLNPAFFRLIYEIVPGTKFFRAPDNMFMVVAMAVAVRRARAVHDRGAVVRGGHEVLHVREHRHAGVGADARVFERQAQQVGFDLNHAHLITRGVTSGWVCR